MNDKSRKKHNSASKKPVKNSEMGNKKVVKKQTCILILGMHRSGTSALSGTLNVLDVYLGTELMKPVEQNAKGFYENMHLYRLNEKLLKQMSSCWDDVFYTESKLKAIEDTTELEQVLKQEFQYSQLFAIKDPRLAYLFPLYTKALTNMGVEIKVIIPFRNPLEVAGSLETRNQFSQEKGLLLWLNHFLLSEKITRTLPRVFTRFDELIESPQAVIKQIDKKLNLDLSSKYAARKNEISDFLTPSLKRHNISLDNLSENVPKPIRDIVSLVPNLNETQLDAKFDELYQQLFDNQTLFYNNDILKSMQELEQAKQSLQAKDNELEQCQQSLQVKIQELGQAKQNLQAMDRELVQSKQTLQTKDKELEQTKQALQARDKELEQTKQALQARDKELEQTKQGLQAKDDELKQIKYELVAMHLSSSWKITRTLRKAKRFFRLKK